MCHVVVHYLFGCIFFPLVDCKLLEGRTCVLFTSPYIFHFCYSFWLIEFLVPYLLTDHKVLTNEASFGSRGLRGGQGTPGWWLEGTGVCGERALCGAGEADRKEDIGWLLKLFLKGESNSPHRKGVSKSALLVLVRTFST